jgi:tripartite-type tricarboxylate transporter receptor subunit TctC
MSKFNWVGVPVQDLTVCALTKASGITSLEQWLAAKEPVKLGGEAPGANDSDAPRILKLALGLPIQLIEGYKGTSQIRLAAEAGEVAGGCWTWESIKVTWQKALEAGLVNVVLQINRERHSELTQVPNAIEYAKTDEGRQLLQLGVHDPGAVLRAYALPPGTPKDRVEILRKAFMATMKDADFVTEMKKSNFAIDPLPGEQVEKIITGFFKLPPAQVARLKEVLGVQN